MEEYFVLKSLNLFLIFGFFIHIEGTTVTLLPESVAQVCQAGDPLELTCTVNGTFMRWSITARNSLGRFMEYGPTFVTAEDESQQVKDVRVNSLTFTFRRSSARYSSPLVSTLVVNSSSVSRGLNGTVVSCTDIVTSTTATTTIHYMDDTPLDPIMIRTSEEYRADSIAVIIEWTQWEDASYNITIIPMVPMIHTGSTSVQLIASYNTEYSVSLEASTVCQSIGSSNITLFYANCGLLSLSAADNISTPSLMHSGLPIEGSMVNLSCPPGMILNGNHTTTCTRNGVWEPNPQNVNCVAAKCGYPMINSPVAVVGYGDNGVPANVGTTVTFVCPPDLSLIGENSTTCTGNEEWKPDPSVVTCTTGILHESGSESDINAVTVTLGILVGVLLISNVLLFIMGCVCHHYLYKKLAKSGNQTTPAYSDRQLAMHMDSDERDVELEQNVAYGHFRRENISGN